MKKFKLTRIGIALIGAVCLLASPVAFQGCTNTSPNAVAYRAYGTTHVTVKTAMSLWDAYLASNKVDAATELKVKSAYEKWQSAMALVADAGAVYSAAVHDGNATILQSTLAAFEQAVSNGEQLKQDLFAVISAITGKPVS